MPLYKVSFRDNIPVSAIEILSGEYKSLKAFEHADGRTNIKWYIVQALDKDNAIDIAGKLVQQIWGDILIRKKKSSAYPNSQRA